MLVTFSVRGNREYFDRNDSIVDPATRIGITIGYQLSNLSRLAPT